MIEIWVKIALLCICMFTLERYIALGYNIKLHRMLPLLMEVAIVYQFCEIATKITGPSIVVERLNSFLIVLAAYFLLLYVMDMLNVKSSKILEVLLGIPIFLIDCWILMGYDEKLWFKIVFFVYIIIDLLTLVVLATIACIKQVYSIKKYTTAMYLYVAALFPTATLIIKYVLDVNLKMQMSVALTVSSCIIYMLMIRGRLEDVVEFLRESTYFTSDLPTILYDEDMFYLDANEEARKQFSDEIEAYEKKKISRDCSEWMREIVEKEDGKREVYFGDMGDGERYMRCRINPEYKDGKIKGYILHILDVTEEKKETKKMRELKAEAEKRTDQKSKFLARMSHDLRSPLHAIIGISEILGKKKDLSEKNRALVMHMHNEGKNLLEQVNSILEYSKLESGKYELEEKPYNIEKVLEDIAFSSVVNLKSKPVHFSASIVTKHPKELIGDEMRVREIMQNILSNAVKFTKIGEIRCELSIENKGNGEAQVSFLVSDSGNGVSKEKIEEMFDEYVSEETSREGIGLGLSIVKQLTELMGGGVIVSSDGKSGTDITAYFTQKVSEDAEVLPVMYSRELFAKRVHVDMESVNARWVYPNARVLMADDVKVNHIVFGEMAAQWKFKIDYVKTGREAVEAVSKNYYQMIFLDQMMPEMTGIEAAELIKRRSQADMVLVTADISDKARIEYKKYGFCDYLAKPIDVYRLKNIIEEHMPKEYREEPEEVSIGREQGNIKAYRRMLETFVKEVEPLLDKLKDAYNEDLEFYKIKVHGIRGVSRQIGMMELSEKAEILEMAAKTSNISYIERRNEEFINDMKEGLTEIKKELRFIPKISENTESSGKDFNYVLGELKRAFEEYDISLIEKNLDIIEYMELSGKERELFDSLKDYALELEYEEGIEKIEDFEKSK